MTVIPTKKINFFGLKKGLVALMLDIKNIFIGTCIEKILYADLNLFDLPPELKMTM